jgi:hypothetical protein
VGPFGQAELMNHTMSPFNLFHEVIMNRDNKWNFDDPGISIFTYVSLFGSGFVDALVVFLLQFIMPISLFFLYTSGREKDEVAAGTRVVLFAVLFYYFFKVNQGKKSQSDQNENCIVFFSPASSIL